MGWPGTQSYNDLGTPHFSAAHFVELSWSTKDSIYSLNDVSIIPHFVLSRLSIA